MDIYTYRRSLALKWLGKRWLLAKEVRSKNAQVMGSWTLHAQAKGALPRIGQEG